MDGKPVQEGTLSTLGVYLFLYICIFILGTLIVSLEAPDFATSFTASLTCLSNVGPGLNAVGPANNFAFFSPLIKWFLSFLMLAGRLEIYPILALFSISVWKKN